MSRGRQLSKAVLLVEGNDDKHVFWALLAANEARVPDGSFAIVDCGGDVALLENLRVRLKANNDTRIGVVIDADTDVAGRWASLRAIVNGVSPNSMPGRPPSEGMVAQLHGGARLGVWLMPNNLIPGMLEDFVAFLVPEGDELWPHARAYVSNARDEGARFPVQHAAKAELHAWLAVQTEPGKPMGQAITARYLDSSAQAVEPLLAWLERLFVAP
jgi:hypothetical protein